MQRKIKTNGIALVMAGVVVACSPTTDTSDSNDRLTPTSPAEPVTPTPTALLPDPTEEPVPAEPTPSFAPSPTDVVVSPTPEPIVVTPTPTPIAVPISGSALKGPFERTSAVVIEQIDGPGRITTEIDSNSQYSAILPWQGLTRVTVKGRFYDELTEALSEDSIELVAIGDAAPNANINVNVLTTMQVQRSDVLVNNGVARAKALQTSWEELAGIFGIETKVFTDLEFIASDVDQSADNESLALISMSMLALKSGDSTKRQKSLIGDITNFFARVQEYLALVAVESDKSADPKVIKAALENNPARLLSPLVDSAVCLRAFESLRENFPRDEVVDPCPNGEVRPVWPRSTQFTAFASPVAEGDSSATVSRLFGIIAPPPIDTIRIPFETFDGTATKERDYQAQAGHLVFAPGETEASVELLINGDEEPEPNEAFGVAFSRAPNVLLGRRRVDVLILNDDGENADSVLDDFEISEFAIADIRGAGRSLPSPIGGPRSIPVPLSLILDFAFTVPCTPSRDNNPAQPCENPRPVFEFEIFGDNGGGEVLLATFVMSPEQVNYRGVSGFDQIRIQREIPLDQNLINALLAQGTLERMSIIGRAQVRVRVTGPDGRPTRASRGPIDRSIAGPVLLPHFERLVFGDQISLIDSVVTGASCGINALLVSGAATLNGEQFNYQNLCVAVSSDGTLSVLQGSVTLAQQQLQQAGLLLNLGVVTLSAQGQTTSELSLVLPNGMLAHPGAAFQSIGSRLLVLSDVSITGDGAEASAGPVWLSQEGLPLIFRLDGLRLGSQGLDGVVAEIGYLPRQRVFATGDSRATPLAMDDLVLGQPQVRRYLHSNDIQWSRPESGAATVLFIDGSGLDVSGINLRSGGGGVAFPRVSKRWADFDAEVRDGVLRSNPDSAVARQRIVLRQTSGCSECDVAPLNAPPLSKSILSMDFDNFVQDGKGELLARGALRGTPGWGSRDANGQRRFERDDRGVAAMYWQPGYWLTGSATAESVADWLLGSRDGTLVADSLIWGMHHRASSSAARRGNGFFAGLTLGPQLLRGADGEPRTGSGSRIADRGMTIRLGHADASTALQMDTQAGSKYVVRSGGVSGVFHNSAPNPTQIYGYDMGFEQFAFRVRQGTVDSYSWIDGALVLAGNAGMKLEFESLAINCDGSLSGGLLSPGLCASEQRGPNCGLVLDAWQAPTEVLGMRFVADADDGVCAASNRVLELDQVVDIAALQRPVMLEAQWSRRGELQGGTISGAGENILDQQGDSPGFSVLLGDNISMPVGAEAWFQFDAVTVGVPFWSALPAQMRLANQSPAAAQPSLLAKSGISLENARNASVLAALPERTDHHIDAHYRWGATDFSIELPVFYAGRHPEGGAQWLGRNLQQNLLLIDVNQGIDYIRPTATKLSFGASADFARLRALEFDLNIDILDADSLARVDRFLDSNLNIQLDLEGQLGDLTRLLNPLAQLTGPGLEGLLERSLQFGVEQVAVGLGADPFELAASGWGELQSMPSLLTSTVTEPARDLVSSLDQRLGNELSGVLNDVAGELTLGLAQFNTLILQYQQAVLDNNQGEIERLGGEEGAIAELRSDLAEPLARTRDEIIEPISVLENEIIRIEELATQLLADVQGVIANTSSSVIGESVGSLREALHAISAPVNSAGDSLLDLLVDVQDCSFLPGDGSSKALFGTAANTSVVIPNVPLPTSFDISAPQFNFYFPNPDVPDPALFNRAPDPYALTRPFAVVLQFTQQLAVALGQVQSIAGVLQDLAGSIGDDANQAVQALTNISDLAGDLSSEIESRLQAASFSGLCRALPIASYTQPVVDQFASYVSQIDEYERVLNSELANLETLLLVFLGEIQSGNQQLADRLSVPGIRRQLASVRATIERLEGGVQIALDEKVEEAIDFNGAVLTTQQEWIDAFNEELMSQTGMAEALFTDTGFTAIDALRQGLRSQVVPLLDGLENRLELALRSALATVPSFTADELRAEFVRLLLQSNGAEALLTGFNDSFAEALDQRIGIELNLRNQLNFALRDVLSAVIADANALIEQATAPLGEFSGGMVAGGVDGYAIIGGNELQRAHLDARFAVPGADEDTGWGFDASLDIASWSANGKSAGCGGGDADLSSLLDVGITARDLPLGLGGDEIIARQIALGVTLDGVFPIGIQGLVDTVGALDFQAFQVYDMAAAAGFGSQESFLGARAAVTLDSLQAEAAFLVGRTCNFDVLQSLDPEAASFVDFGPNFDGGFIRAKANVPIWSNGCALTVGVGADMGGWVINRQPVVIGGIFGGGAFGELGCIASLRGQVTAYGQLVGDQFSFRGEGFGAAGAGFDCDPHTWTSVSRSRRDSWCGTGDASFSAEYNNGWSLGNPGVSAIH